MTVRPYNHTTIQLYKVLLLTCVVNCTMDTPMPRLCSVIQWSVHWALSRTTRVLVLAKARRCALEKCGKKKKKQALLLGLAKSMLMLCHLHTFCKPYDLYVDVSCNFISVVLGAEQSRYYQ